MNFDSTHFRMTDTEAWSQESLVVRPVPMNITTGYESVYSRTLIAVAGLDLCTTVFFLWLIYITSSLEYMKVCEKVLICNAIVPDLCLEIFLLTVVSSATEHNEWTYGKFTTRWLAFFHTVCIFHSELAMALICYMISLSLTDIYRFEKANDLRHMCALVCSSLTVTICFCSLPATENEGYALLQNWQSPSFNVNSEYGSIFAVSALLAIILPLMFHSIFLVFRARSFFKKLVSRNSSRALADIDKIIVFDVLAVLSAVCMIPAVSGSSNQGVMFVFRMIMYTGPFFRCLTLLLTCPHFQFAIGERTSGDADLMILDVDEVLDAQKRRYYEELMQGGK